MSPQQKKEHMVQCPRCGKHVQELFSGTCRRCLIETKNIVQLPKMRLSVCPECLRYKDANVWKEGGDDLESTIVKAVEEQLPRRLRVSKEVGFLPRLLGLRAGNARVSKGKAALDLDVELGDVGSECEALRVRFSTTMPLNRGLCRVCQLKHSEFFACILQVRAEGRCLEDGEIDAITSLIQEREAAGDPNSMHFMSKIVDRKEGRDFYLGSTSFGREVAKDILLHRGGSLTESRKLVGLDKATSKNLYKFTILLRLPNLRIGDVTELNGSLYAVLHHTGSRTTLLGLDGRTLSYEGPEELPLVSRCEDIGKALVLEVRPDGIQILDPRTNKTFDLEDRPEGITVGTNVDVVWREEVPQLAPTIEKEAEDQ